MTKFRISLLMLALIGIGAFWVFVRLSEREPEVMRNTLVCPDCGRLLTQADAPCLWCQAKKDRALMEEALRQASAKREPSNAGKGIVKGIIAAGLAGALLVFAYWPRIRRLLRLDNREEAVEFLYFHCSHCGRKLRYDASKAGMPGKCPCCKASCTFPVA